MKSRIVLIVVLVLCLAGSGIARDVPRAELFLGYPLPVGIDISAAVNINRWIGIVEEYCYSIAEYYGDWPLHMIAGGPKLTARSNSRWTPFAHVLIGIAGAGSSHWYAKTFTTVLGGGIDVRVYGKLTIRAIQGNLILTHFDSKSQQYLVLSFGLIFRLGKI
jgi:hypothetical protein